MSQEKYIAMPSSPKRFLPPFPPALIKCLQSKQIQTAGNKFDFPLSLVYFGILLTLCLILSGDKVPLALVLLPHPVSGTWAQTRSVRTERTAKTNATKLFTNLTFGV